MAASYYFDSPCTGEGFWFPPDVLSVSETKIKVDPRPFENTWRNSPKKEPHQSRLLACLSRGQTNSYSSRCRHLNSQAHSLWGASVEQNTGKNLSNPTGSVPSECFCIDLPIFLVLPLPDRHRTSIFSRCLASAQRLCLCPWFLFFFFHLFAAED